MPMSDANNNCSILLKEFLVEWVLTNLFPSSLKACLTFTKPSLNLAHFPKPLLFIQRFSLHAPFSLNFQFPNRSQFPGWLFKLYLPSNLLVFFKILKDKGSDNALYLLFICDCIHFLFNHILVGLSNVYALLFFMRCFLNHQLH